ncbi:RNA polymerase II subunit A C-terminal domain phosphatase [Dryobates pubescens]|uniref:RNA polymerase II subunit A C-terminal domain phosphatase n=1 Tax=Dryobates pubescens TaxID=118200 RepID=UPI0023B94BDC|nr:RNA polymerase II subunit A C-terminal domain phosphatase [Dryobates pubescens]
MEGPAERGGEAGAEGTAGVITEIRAPGPRPLRLLEWKVSVGTAVQIGSVLALCAPLPPAPPPASGGASGRPQRPGPERKLKAERPGVVRELCARPGQVIAPGGVLVRLEGCSHPVVMKGLCAECGQDLTQIGSRNGRQSVALSTATVSMVHSVPELKVSSEQAEQLGREDQQRLHRSRKLVLMVDLDQTLIHTTEQHCQQMSNKGIFHFQLGRGEPMLHTRLRPHCKEFLEKIAKLYELHVFTFGSRLYAHTIAGFLDPEKKLFSHRILSRDECIDPFSKTGNLRDLFPCGDSMVCIIDDREDVWKFAPNLITVKKYVYFQGIGDINAPPAARDPHGKRRANHSPRAEALEPAPAAPRDGEEVRSAAANGSGAAGAESPAREAHPAEAPGAQHPAGAAQHPAGAAQHPAGAAQHPAGAAQHPAGAAQHPAGAGGRHRTEGDAPEPPDGAAGRQRRGRAGGDLDFELSSDSESEAGADPGGRPPSADPGGRPPSADPGGRPPALPGSEGRRSWRKAKEPLREGSGGEQNEGELRGGLADRGGEPEAPGSASGRRGAGPGEGEPEEEEEEEGEQGEALSELGNGCADKKEAETESQNSEQSGITMGESLDQSVGEEEEEEDTDDDDHLIHLEEILARVHSDYYRRYDRFLRRETPEPPDIRRIVPELRSRVLADVTILFSGLYPTNFPVERTREHYHATALGAKVVTSLLPGADAAARATHLIAARTGTEKVRQAQDCKDLHVVNPDWLWSCLERWDKVEEQLFPLKDDYIKTHRESSPATFPEAPSSFQTALFHPTPIHPRSQPGPEVRLYDPTTGKLIRKGAQPPGQALFLQAPAAAITLPGHGEHSSFRVVQPQQQLFAEELAAGQAGEQAAPCRRKRQPSMSETMPLYTLCREELESMDREVDDILGEGSDESDSERKKPEEEGEKPEPGAAEPPGLRAEQRPGSSSSSSSSSSSAAAGSGRSSAGSVHRGHKRKLEEEEDGGGSDSSKDSSNEDEEGSSSEADEMAAALEAELNDFI